MKSYHPFQIVDHPGRPSLRLPMYPPCRAMRIQNSAGVSVAGSVGSFLFAPATTTIHKPGDAALQRGGLWFGVFSAAVDLFAEHKQSYGGDSDDGGQTLDVFAVIQLRGFQAAPALLGLMELFDQPATAVPFDPFPSLLDRFGRLTGEQHPFDGFGFVGRVRLGDGHRGDAEGLFESPVLLGRIEGDAREAQLQLGPAGPTFVCGGQVKGAAIPEGLFGHEGPQLVRASLNATIVLGANEESDAMIQARLHPSHGSRYRAQ